jgi:glycerophosphoryl diester phosphodiesterase
VNAEAPARPAPPAFPAWIAHRGAGRQAPENTLVAFRFGAARGYRAFECDVKLSADGVPFLLHDATLERTTNGAGPAGDLPWAELSRLDAGGWHSARYTGEPLPTFDAVAAWCVANGHALDIEIKPSPGAEAATGEAVARAAAVHWPAGVARAAAPDGTRSVAFLSSFRPEALAAAMAAVPTIPRALLIDECWPGWEDVAQHLECFALITNHRLLDEALAARARALGLALMCYTVNDAEDAARLARLGVEALVTDEVHRFDPAAMPPSSAAP